MVKMKPENLITLPNRGLRIIPPVETAKNMVIAKNLPSGGAEKPRIVWSEREKTRIWLIKNCKILSRRYPSQEHGEQFMEIVDYERREELLKMANELSEHIVETWKQISPNKKIAVLLYGSVAKGLVKAVGHAPASDIDLTAIGNFTDSERSQLRARIHPKREEITSRIVNSALGESGELDIRYAGALVQNATTLTKNNYSDALNYIKSGAATLHDPAGIWKAIENDALDYASQLRRGYKPREASPSQPLTIWLEDDEDPRSNAVFNLFAEKGIPLDTGIHAPIADIDMQAGVAYFPRRNINNES